MTEEIEENEVRFPARDGYGLSGRIIAPRRPKAAVLISSGTGFPHGLYRRIAVAGAERGFACLIYDYRGIAASAPPSLKGFKADILDWGRLDFTAALDQARALAPDRPLFTLGHSVGGHLIGFADNIHTVRAHAMVCSGTGYWGAHDPSYRRRVLFFWRIYGPACLALKGYLPAGGLWGGEALPREVFRQWRRWAFMPNYFGDDFDAIGQNEFARITTPIRNYAFTDDKIASERSVSDFMRLFSAAPRDLIRLSPQDVGAARVDPFGAFKRDASAFWPMPFDWFETYL